MLSASDVNLTPRRPKPPAKLRRASKEKSRTPPVPALQLNLDSDNPPPPYDEQDDLQEKLKERLLPALEEWMHDRSREELSDLLLAAGGMIKERESELGLTSKLCKNLYQENVSLKTKHEALLARIPIPTQASASAPSPLPSPTRSLSPLPPGSPHYYSISRPTSPTMSPFSSNSSPAIRRAGHARRISVTPSELTVLADQNAELMHKLERLEEESTQADLQGKKKLRKLEKEIALLREELERTRERGNELEEKVLGVVQKVGEDESESERKKREREERVRALRGTKRAEKAAEQVVDFAPAPELSRSNKIVPPPIKLAPSSPLPEDETTLTTPSATSSTAITPSSTSETFTLPENLPPQSLEHSIINQLLGKIHELEVTNQQISAEQQATAERLQAAQKDVDNIRRAYDCLDESEELCVVQEDGDFDIFADPMSPVSPPKRIPTGQTIRFSSLRRNLEGDITSLAGTDDPSDFFDSGVVRQSTTRGGFDVFRDEPVEDGQKPRQAPKARKTVVGLFTSPSIAPPAQSDLSPISMPGNLADVSGWSTTANDSLTVPGPSTSPTDSHRSGSVSPSVYASPMPGGLDFPMSPEPAQVSFPSTSMHSHTHSQSSYLASPSLSTLDVPNISRPLHSLGSELGSEYEYGFGNRALSEMGDIDEDREDVGSVADSGIVEDDVFSEGPSNVWDLRRRVISGTTVVGSSRSIASDDDYVASTPTKPPRRVFPRDPYASDDGSSRAPRVVVQPPTPSPNRILNKGKGKGGLEAEKLEKYSRNTRLSMTVRARTSRWVERRYEHGSGSIDIPETIPDTGLVPFPSSSSVVVFPTSTATPETHQQPKRRRSLMSLQTGMGIHRAVKNVAASEMWRVSSGGAYVRERKRTMDETFEEAVHRVSRSISFSGGQDGFDFEANVISRRAARGGSDGDRTPSRMQRFTFPPPKPRMSTSEPHKPQAQAKPAQKEEVAQHKGFVGFVLEIWLWLQFAVVIMVFLWAMARRGPKSVLEDAERTVARRRA